jgi:hypothetical protein
MQQMRTGEPTDFPRYGSRARAWSRFERDLRAWLETPEGRFAAWRAARQAAPPASSGAVERADRTS